MRLAKFLAHAGIASRRRAEDLVRAGRVSVGGITVRDPARDVDEQSGVQVDGRAVAGAEPHEVWALNKPTGVVSTAKDTHGRRTVLDLLPRSEHRLYPVGRLDADTTGLILLTNDGALANRLMHPSFEVPKTYRVKVARPPVREGALHALRKGVELDDGMTAPALVRRLHADELDITIHEGRKRQVRRMCEAVGHPVVQLTRTAFGPLSLGALKPGDSRRLHAREVQALRDAAKRAARTPDGMMPAP
jgi:23S rRNA pseudouridine2605 synthase